MWTTRSQEAEAKSLEDSIVANAGVCSSPGACGLQPRRRARGGCTPGGPALRPSRGRALASWGHGAHGGGGCCARLGRDLGGRGTPSAPSPPRADPTAQAEASAPRAGEGTPSPAFRARSPGEEALSAAFLGHAGPRGCSAAGVRGAPGPAARVLPRSGLLSSRASAAWFSGFLWMSPGD